MGVEKVRGPRIFVSYGREDEKLVGPVSQLIEYGDADVFWDKKIPPGSQWKEVIADRVRSADKVVILWCCHSGASQWVPWEVSIAREDARKPVTPVLLCNHPVDDSLKDYQWIDVRNLLVHPCSHVGPTGAGATDPSSLRLVSGEQLLSAETGLDASEIRRRSAPEILALLLETLIDRERRRLRAEILAAKLASLEEAAPMTAAVPVEEAAAVQDAASAPAAVPVEKRAVAESAAVEKPAAAAVPVEDEAPQAASPSAEAAG